MNKSYNGLLITFFAILVISIAQADSATDMFKQGWQSAKQMGSQVVDTFNLSNYKKEMKKAEVALDSCIKSKNACVKEQAAYEGLKARLKGKDKASPRLYQDAEQTYLACAKAYCKEEHDNLMKAKKAYNIRAIGIGAAASLGAGAVAVAAVGGTAGTLITLELSKQRKEQLDIYTKRYNLSPDQSTYLRRIMEASTNLYENKADLPFIKNIIKEYAASNTKVNLNNDSLIRALEAYTGKTKEELGIKKDRS